MKLKLIFPGTNRALCATDFSPVEDMANLAALLGFVYGDELSERLNARLYELFYKSFDTLCGITISENGIWAMLRGGKSTEPASQTTNPAYLDFAFQAGYHMGQSEAQEKQESLIQGLCDLIDGWLDSGDEEADSE